MASTRPARNPTSSSPWQSLDSAPQNFTPDSIRQRLKARAASSSILHPPFYLKPVRTLGGTIRVNRSLRVGGQLAKIELEDGYMNMSDPTRATILTRLFIQELVHTLTFTTQHGLDFAHRRTRIATGNASPRDDYVISSVFFLSVSLAVSVAHHRVP
ncbi:hypothetical protein DL96DRAFT_1709896 [Flagelloscypha sp. PMI_526]|nr:hypothetical protein DL96DRAFT_1709896 [Flagelloscypha sp. PMI_526]